MIDISKLDKAEVLAALYNRSKAQGMGWINFDPAPMTATQARALLDDRERLAVTLGGTLGTYRFDYIQGRVMKVDLGGDELDERLYDRDNGAGAAARALEPLIAAVAAK
jgi:hypothetical protein